MNPGKFMVWMAGCLVLAVLAGGRAVADDTCVFAVTANDVPPNVVILLDNGAEMEQITWHPSFNNAVNYATGPSIFTNPYGYVVEKQATNKYALRPINADLTTYGAAVAESTTNTFTINSRTITLPVAASKEKIVVGLDGVIDNINAKPFRYAANYLSWLFYGPYTKDGADLPAKSRFFYAKTAIFAVARETANRARFGIYSGTSNVQPLGMVVNTPLVSPSSNNTLDSNFVNAVNNMVTQSKSPLAAGLAAVGGYYESRQTSSYVVDYYCQRSFALVVSPGVSSGDSMVAKSFPDKFGDYDKDGLDVGRTLTIDGTTYTIPVNTGGNTYLDDVAHFMANNDMVPYRAGNQYVNTYTVGFMGSEASRRFLINTSNNGNEKPNLQDSSDPDYGKYHFEASSPAGLAQAIIDALSAILEKTNAFAAPVVPITRTTSGNRLYMSFFTPSASSNFWMGNVVKFGLNSNLEVVDKNGDLATYPNGALKETAEPYWATVDWADSTKTNYVLNSNRHIYSYLGTTTALTNTANQFKTDNAMLTAAVLDTTDRDRIINYIRGADAFDEDGDGQTAENRTLITGDVLHSEPLVVQFIHSAGALTLSGITGLFQDNEIIRGSSGGYARANGTLSGAALSYDELRAPFTVGEQLRGVISGATATVAAVPDATMIFYGANDGMLHAVRDMDGKEAWAFIPPNQLSRLKNIVEATAHQFYVDGSAKAYLHDVNGNGFIDLADGDRMILICGERKGSDGYFALDITNPESPLFLWRINGKNEAGEAGTSALPAGARATQVSDLGESWSEAQFGRVKTTDSGTDSGTAVMFIGGGYDAGNSKGRAVLAIDIFTGLPVKIFKNAAAGTNISGMDYSIPSNVRLLDTNNNGFIDKVYVGDMGGNLWRIGRFTDSSNTPFPFPGVDENINNWQGHKLFAAGCNESSCTDGVDNNTNNLVDEYRKFFYAPSVVLERGYDLVFIASGDRENPCHGGTADEAYAIRDNHSSLTLSRTDLVDVTSGAAVDVDGGDKGWRRRFATGEKALSEGTVFAGYYIFTTFLPTTDACVPGGIAYLYIVDYKTGAGFFPDSDVDVDTRPDAAIAIGGGIPSRPVIVLSDSEMAIYTSVGSTNPDDSSPSTTAGITVGPDVGKKFNYFLLWWKGLYEN